MVGLEERILTRDEYIAEVETAIRDRIRRMAAGKDCVCGECVALVQMTPQQRAEEVGREYDGATTTGHVALATGGWRLVR
jgi:hypothetical protein